MNGLHETQLAAELATALYDFLPGKPNPYADAELVLSRRRARGGVESPVAGGSKTPARTQLLTATLREERHRFCPFLIAVVQRAVTYRANKAPLTREEVDRVNHVVASRSTGALSWATSRTCSRPSGRRTRSAWPNC